jgi:transforming growth factor-beta-induced protein
MKKTSIQFPFRKVAGIAAFGLFSISASAQTNVFDNVIATSPNHSSLEAALIAADLDDDLQNAAGTFTVFAPDNAAFSALATQLGVTVNDLLALPNLADILKYHVLGSEVPASAVTNGAIVTPLFVGNTLKLTKTAANAVFINHAQVNAADLTADNGIVHSINAVLSSSETVVDVAIDNGFTTLTAAVIQEEFVPVLSDPFTEVTVFAPTNAAFNNLATALGTDLAGILNLPNLSDVLTYHAVFGNVNAADLVNGPVATVNGANIIVNLASGVKINDATVTTADVEADNGVVHVIDKVLLESFLGINEADETVIGTYPNPAADVISFVGLTEGDYTIFNNQGQVVKSGSLNNGQITIQELSEGSYMIQFNNANKLTTSRFIKK